LNKRTIDINRLEIRLTGISAQSARSAVSDLGSELIRELASLPLTSNHNRTVRIGSIDSGKVHVPEGSTPADLRGAIAQRVTGSIQAKLESQSRRR